MKEILYSCPNIEESEETKKMYRTTHGFSDPGEQYKRNYKWNMNITNHSFGKEIEKEYDGAKKSLMSDTLESNFPNTKIVTKRLEDYREATEDKLGKTKYRGTINPNISEEFVFGSPTIKNSDNHWNAAKCIQGDFNRNVEPDSDLGKSTLYKSRLSARHPREYDPNKTFGVPSVRQDLPMKKIISVCDTNVNLYIFFLINLLKNYGNEKDAFELLYPNPHVFKGLDNKDFNDYIPKDQVFIIFNLIKN